MTKKPISIAFAALILSAACSSDPASRAADTSPASNGKGIAITNFAFDPDPAEAAIGDTIVWTNEDDIAHTVTSGRAKKQGVPGVSTDRDAAPDGAFDSGTMELNDSFEFVAEESGTFTYFCAIHAGMSAQLVIR